MKTKRILAGLLVGASLLSFAACGTTGKSSETVSQSESESESETQHVVTPQELASKKMEQQERLANIARQNYSAALETIAEYLPAITCWGDSLTAGGVYANYVADYIKTTILDLYDPKALVDPDYLDVFDEDEEFPLSIPVYNMGVGGETSATILGRSGAIPFVTDKDFTIPADTTPVEITFKSASGKQVDPLVQNESGNRGVNNCTIAGVEGTLTIVKNTPGEIHIFHGLDKYYFTRLEAGSAVNVRAGEEIVTSGKAHLSDFPIIYIGQNGGWSDVNDLIGQINAIIGEHERYIVLTSHHNQPFSYTKPREEALKEAFGDHLIILREYMSSEQAITDANELFDADITPSAEDLNYMGIGQCPKCLLSDATHFNTYGYKLIGYLVTTKMEELGYFDEIREALDLE